MTSQIPLQRLVLYLVIAAFLPFVALWFYYNNAHSRLQQVELLADSVELAAVNYERKQAQNRAVAQHFSDADHFYIDKHLESLTLMEEEVEALKKLTNKEGVAITDKLIQRLDYLAGPDNSLQFTEGVVDAFPHFQETTESLTHSVEVSVDDLQRILTRIEGVSIGDEEVPEGRPQLIITDFKIERRNIRPSAEVWILNLKLLKREFL